MSRTLLQGVSKIGGHILAACSMDQNKEETSGKMCLKVLFWLHDQFKYQNTNRAASCSRVQGGHFEHLL
jgi:hypothetical protein